MAWANLKKVNTSQASDSGNPPFLIPALLNIVILLHKLATKPNILTASVIATI
jgi:hypothetical protein